MNFTLPGLTRKNYGLVRITCFAVSILTVLAVSHSASVAELLTKVENTLGMGSPVLSLVLRALLVLLVNSVLVKLTRTLWLHFDRVPLDDAEIKTSDILIYKTGDITGIPAYKSELNKLINTPDTGVTQIVNTIVGMGFSLQASDIHFNPAPDKAEVTFRIDGNLYPMGEIPTSLYQHLIRRVKILSDLSIFKQGVPQDGQLNFESEAYTARVSVFPTNNGERIALRLVRTNARIMDIENIGMPENILPDYKAMLNRSQGMIVITGPTGSGKSTTMFSSLLYIKSSRKDSINIVTLEDPVETNLEGFQQTRVGQAPGLTFSTGLRSVLRQDPDVIMLGEIRDEETASVAIRAAMTGHLLLTTVHANSTSGVFNRLSQMGVDPVQLSSTVHAVVSQRLCRRLCPSCRKTVELNEFQVKQLKLLGIDSIPETPFYEAEGCSECLGLGFVGQVALFEMLVVNDFMRDFITQGLPAHQLSRKARTAGMPTLLQHGLEYAKQGIISLDELTRIVSE